jgi:type II restriction enzyme
VGCNILLGKIPVHARIPIVSDGSPHSPREVRGSYNRLRPLEKLNVEKRGWTLDVLQVVQSLKKTEFSLHDVYEFEEQLSRLHPANRNIKPKIRQQLQILRDLGLLRFLSPGLYRLV